MSVCYKMPWWKCSKSDENLKAHQIRKCFGIILACTLKRVVVYSCIVRFEIPF